MNNRLQWRVNIPSLFEECLKNNGSEALKIPLQYTMAILRQVAERAIEIDDPELHLLMCRLALYECSDPNNSDYDPNIFEELREEIQRKKGREMTINTKQMRELAQKEAERKNKSKLENIEKTVNYFLDMILKAANKGLFEKKTTCVIKRGVNKFFVQTSDDGNGFDAYDMEAVVKKIRERGFKVEFVEKQKGYSKLNFNWE